MAVQNIATTNIDKMAAPKAIFSGTP